MRFPLLLAGLLLALVALGFAAEARMHHPGRGHRIVPAASAPLDGFTQPAAAYGFRKLLSAYTGPGLVLRRASDNAELSINFLGYVPGIGAPLDVAQANAHCAATTCFVKGFFDQSGAGRDVWQFSGAGQPTFVASCQNFMPCARFTSNPNQLASSSVSWASSLVSLSAVAKRTSGTGQCYWMRRGINGLGADTSATWFLYDAASGYMPITGVTENVWHAINGVVNGASSVVRVDAAEVTGVTVTGSSAASVVYFNGAAATTCDWAEGIVWDGYLLTPAERAALRSNQQSFWGTP